MAARVEPRAVVRDTNHITREPNSQASPTVQDRTAVRIKETETCTKLCKLSKRNYKLSPYFEFKRNTALNKEGNSNKFACWSNKRVHRELGFNNTRSLGTADSSGFSVATSGSANSGNSSTTVTAVPRTAGLGINRGTGNDRKKGYKWGATRSKGFVSQIFLVPKKDGGHRPVVNLKALNKFIVEEHFKMEGFHMVKDLVKPGDWLAKLDLKDAYFLVPVDPNHQKFLQFQWQGNLYQFHCLPFGLSCAPRTFTKLMKPVVAFLRERGIRLIIYLDDLLILCNCRDTLLSQLELIKDLFQTLGLLINNKKSQLESLQEIVFLGLTISTIAMQVSLPKEKVTRIQQEARQMLSKTEVSVQKLAAFVGMTTAVKQAVRVAPLFHRHLQAVINRVVPLASSLEEVRQSYHQIVEISREASQELGWWMQEMQNYNKAPLLADPPDLVIESDASRLGWEQP